MATSSGTAKHEVLPDVWLDSRRAVWFARFRALVVADVHWGYAASHRRRGNLLPDWGDAEIGSGLQALIADYRPEEMIWLGDSLHTLAGRGLAEEFLRSAGVATTVLAGNHDTRWTAARERSAARENLFFHHGDAGLDTPAGSIEVIGHFHPSASISDGAGTNIRLPALVASPRRLILPAFSPWAAGVSWNTRLEPGETLWAIAPRRIFALPRTA